MSKSDRTWSPTPTDLDWIESISAPVIPALAAIEAAAEPLGVPIVDRDAGRALRVLAAGRRRIVEFGTAYGYSTLWMALGQPADGTIVTLDPDRTRTDLARGWWREAGIADERIVVVNRPALEAFETDDPALAGPFDFVFIDALKEEYEAYVDGGRGPPRAGRADRRGQRPVERSCVRASARPPPDDESTLALQAFDRGDAGRSADDRHDPAGRRRPAHRHLARLSRSPTMHVTVRLFALQRELVGERHVGLDLADGATVADGWDGARRAVPGAGARSYLGPVRPERRLRGPRATSWPRATSSRSSRPSPVARACRTRADDGRTRIVELREVPFGTEILGELADRLVTDLDGAVVGFLGRTRATPGTPAPGPGSRGRPSRRPGGRRPRVRGPRHHGRPRPGPDRGRGRRALRRDAAGDRPSDRRRAARRRVDRRGGGGRPSRRRVPGGSLRDR